MICLLFHLHHRQQVGCLKAKTFFKEKKNSPFKSVTGKEVAKSAKVNNS
jgi:hypothetical protein